MPKGYRFLIVATFAWLSLAAGPAPQQDVQPNNAASQSEVSAAANAVASAIIKSAQHPENDKGCKDGADNRDSDLCAQWKAADAAESAANYSFWTLFLSAVGTGLLVWTLWETRDTARRELRAYITLKSGNAYGIAVGHRPQFKIELVNSGQTPARKFQSVAGIKIRPKDWDFRVIEPESWGGQFEIGPGCGHYAWDAHDASLTFEEYTALKTGELVIYATIIGRYFDVFGKRQSFTMALYVIDIVEGSLRPCEANNSST